MNKRTFLKSLSVLAAGASLATSQPLIGASHTATPTLVKPKPLKKGVTDSLFFQVEMPYELGNEFQQTSAYFEIIIVAAANTSTTPEDSDDPVKQPDSNVKPTPVNPGTNDTQLPVASQGPKLPNTATNLYLLLTVGLILTTVGLTIIYVNKRLSNKRET